MVFREKHFTESEHTVVIAGQRLYYRVVGEGSPLVLLHGYGVTGSVWEPVIPRLSLKYQLFILDLPGHGRSSDPNTWRLRPIAPMLAEWLDTLHIAPVSVIGESMGGAIAIHLTALAGSSIERLILISPAGLPLQTKLAGLAILNGLSTLQQAKMLLEAKRSLPWNAIRDALQPHLQAHWQAAHEMTQCDFRSELASITIPTLILWGERDILLPLSYGKALHSYIPHATFTPISNSGHSMIMIAPARLCDLVTQFLATAPQRENQP